jgi:purine-binding chemotaxis protein CheW
MPEYVRGVINLRGQVIPLMDVRIRFCMSPREYDERTCVVVVQVKGVSIGLVVDTVNEVSNIPEEERSAPPRIASGTASRYIEGMGRSDDQVKILLSVDKLLFNEELKELGEMVES